jgi:hypothetical protein
MSWLTFFPLQDEDLSSDVTSTGGNETDSSATVAFTTKCCMLLSALVSLNGLF